MTAIPLPFGEGRTGEAVRIHTLNIYFSSPSSAWTTLDWAAVIQILAGLPELRTVFIWFMHMERANEFISFHLSHFRPLFANASVEVQAREQPINETVTLCVCAEDGVVYSNTETRMEG